MRVRDAIKRRVDAIAPGAPLREAARRMSASDAPVLPVCENGRLVGLITARDLIVRATAQGCDPRTSPVREVMTREVIAAREDLELADAVALMHRHRLSRLPVVDRQHHFVGLVSLADLLTGDDE